MKTDYPELEGKELIYKTRRGSEIKARVAGCCYHVGITIVDVNDPENKLVCLNRQIHKKGIGFQTYRQRFFSIVKSIQEGVYDGNKHYKAKFGNGMGLDCSYRFDGICAFM